MGRIIRGSKGSRSTNTGRSIKAGIAKGNSTPVLISGVYYPSIQAASTALKITRYQLTKRLLEKRPGYQTLN